MDKSEFIQLILKYDGISKEILKSKNLKLPDKYIDKNNILESLSNLGIYNKISNEIKNCDRIHCNIFIKLLNNNLFDDIVEYKKYYYLIKDKNKIKIRYYLYFWIDFYNYLTSKIIIKIKR